MGSRECWEPGCGYITPELPTEDEARKTLWQHVESEHPVDKISDVNAKDGRRHSPALVRAAVYGMKERCSELIKRGADTEGQDDDKWTALSWAASMGFLDICQLLVSHGADKEHRINYGRTPLAMAAEWNHYPVAQYLISEGADLESEDDHKNDCCETEIDKVKDTKKAIRAKKASAAMKAPKKAKKVQMTQRVRRVRCLRLGRE